MSAQRACSETGVESCGCGDSRASASGMEKASLRLRELLLKAEKQGVGCTALLTLSGAARLLQASSGRGAGLALLGMLGGVLGLTVALALALGLHTPAGLARACLAWRGEDLHGSQCGMDLPDWLQRAFRPPEDCALCRDLQHVERLAELSPDIFEQRFAYSGRPVVVTDATTNWTAPRVFNFEFFKSIYEQSPQPGCQFFPYQTEFRQLRDVFNMSEERAALHGRPWYVGWSNCDERVARVLRQHYSRPYFLPHHAENKQLDWIFMGSPGYGAHMHVDNVGHASWQAQLRGHKQWVLQPPPECLYQCATMQLVVHPGDIIVLDTNRWYHKTLIVADEMSITIGAEYD